MAFAKLSGALLACDRPLPLANLAPIAPVRLVEPAPAPPPGRPAATAIAPAPRRSNDGEQTLLAQNLKALRLSRFLGEYEKLARQCAAEGQDHYRYLLRLTELELRERKQRGIERRIKAARFPAVKSLDGFEVTALPAHTWGSLLGLADCGYVARRENIIAIGSRGTGKTHLAIGLGVAACEKGLSVGFTNAAALVHELLEASREHRLARLQRRLLAYKLLIVDDLGDVTLPTDGAELLFQVLSQRSERGSTLITSNLPTAEWTRIFCVERLTGTLLERLGHRLHHLEMSDRNYRQKHAVRPVGHWLGNQNLQRPLLRPL